MFHKNKYTNWYYSIISSAKCQLRNKKDGYFESHHIIPKCMGGIETVLLTAREHYVCHLLLTKMTINSKDRARMAFALIQMSRFNENHNRYKAKSKLYEYARKINAKAVSEFHTGKIVSNATRKKLGDVQRGVAKSKHHIDALKASHKGMTGRKHSEETKAKMREARLRSVAKKNLLPK